MIVIFLEHLEILGNFKMVIFTQKKTWKFFKSILKSPVPSVPENLEISGNVKTKKTIKK